MKLMKKVHLKSIELLIFISYRVLKFIAIVADFKSCIVFIKQAQNFCESFGQYFIPSRVTKINLNLTPSSLSITEARDPIHYDY